MNFFALPMAEAFYYSRQMQIKSVSVVIKLTECPYSQYDN
jgi:hypothetical protein